MRAAILVVLIAAMVSMTVAKLVVVSNLQTSTQINTVLSDLEAGDEVVFASGTYTDMDLRLDVSGTADKYIKIRSDNVVKNSLREKTKSVVLRADPSNADSVLKIGTTSSYIEIQGIQFEHDKGATVENPGIRFESNVHHVTITNCVVKDITGIGIQFHDLDEVHDITVKDSAIYNIGLGSNKADKANLGAGISAGSTTGTSASKVYNIVIKNNIFHDLQGNLGSAIYLSQGVRASSCIDNVIWNSPKGAAALLDKKAAVYVAGGAAAAADAKSNIVVKGNAILDSAVGGSNSIAMQLGGGANVYNNLIVNAQTGIDLATTFTTNLRNTRVSHNTVYKIGGTALSAGFTGQEDASFIVANNVFYVGDSITGLIAFTWSDITNKGTAVVKKNFYKGQTVVGELFSDLEAFVSLKGTAETFFSAPNLDIGAGADFLVKGDLLRAGIDADVDTDYDNNDRDSSHPDIGCYETGSGGHWEVDFDFKLTIKAGDSAASNLQPFWRNLF